MSSPETTAVVFERLKAILQRYDRGTLVATETADSYSLTGPPVEISKKRDVWFGTVHMKKGGVTFHLMPLQIFPDLLGDVSLELAKHVQGKSSFRFDEVDERLFKEIARLTEKGYRRYKKEEWLA